MLDLFAGSKSWSKAFREKGFICLSLDLDPRFNCTWTCDIHEWVPPPNLRADVICLGTPCQNVSTANKTKTPEKFEQTENLGRRAFELCDALLKDGGIILAENPSRCESSGCRSRPVGMVDTIRPGLWKTEVNYCRYSSPEHLYSWKKTTIWCNENLSKWFTPKLCNATTRCGVGAIDEATGHFKHFSRMAFVPETRNLHFQTSQKNKQGEWGCMPHTLCRDLADASCAFMRARE